MICGIPLPNTKGCGIGCGCVCMPMDTLCRLPERTTRNKYHYWTDAEVARNEPMQIYSLEDAEDFESLRTLCFLKLVLLLTPELIVVLASACGVSGGDVSSVDSFELAEPLLDLRIIGIPSLFTNV